MSDTDFESFEENEKKLEEIEEDLEAKEEEKEVVIEEDEWLDDDKPIEKEEKEEKEEEVEEKEVEKEKTEKTEADLIKEDLISRLDGKTKYRIKGKEYDLVDVEPETILENLSKGGRFFESMEENAAEKKAWSEDLRKKEQFLIGQAEILRQQVQNTIVEPKEEALPPQLEIKEFDSEDVKALKGVIATQHTDMQKFKTVLQEQSTSTGGRNLDYEIDTAIKEFPLGSKEEIVAILATPEYSHVSIRDAAKASHEHYSGDEYFGKVLEARPEKLRQLKEQHIKEYLAEKGKNTSKRIPRRRSSSTASSKLSTKKEKTIRNFDDIEARHGEIKAKLDGFGDDW